MKELILQMIDEVKRGVDPVVYHSNLRVKTAKLTINKNIIVSSKKDVS